MNYLSETIFDEVDIDKLFVAKYGRPLMVAKVQAIARKFDINAIGTLYLALRNDGRYAVLDGQHRIAAARLCGYTKLPARVFIELSYEQEAALYVKFATVNKQTSMDRFRARIEAREPLALDIVDMLDSLNLRIQEGTGGSQGIVQAVSVIESLYTRHGRGHLRKVLSILHQVWGGEPRAYVHQVLTGLSMFLIRFGDDIDERRLVTRLKLLTPESLLAKASQLRGVLSQSESNSAVGMVILHEYNTGLRTNRLPEQWLRSK